MMPAHDMTLLKTLPPVKGNYFENAPLANLIWFRTGGPAEVLFRPTGEDDLKTFFEGLCRIQIARLLIVEQIVHRRLDIWRELQRVVFDRFDRRQRHAKLAFYFCPRLEHVHHALNDHRHQGCVGNIATGGHRGRQR